MNHLAFLTTETGKPIGSLEKVPITGNSILILVILIISGLLGNYFSIPLFFGADFLFGSIAVLFVLYFFGLRWGMLAAVIAHSYTYFLWEHPYGFINFVGEALFVGIFILKGRRNLLGLVGLFWLAIGMPLVWIEHGVIMHMDAISTAFIMLKQAINGVFNALVVSLAICYLLPLIRLSDHPLLSQKITLKGALYNLLVMMVLLPALFLTGVQINNEKKQLETGLMVQLQSISTNVQFHIFAWYQFHLKAVQELAVVASQSAMKPSAALQQATGILHNSFPNFRTMHVENAGGRSIAFHPSVNEKGDSNLGLDFSDRAWFQGVKAKQRPLVSEVFVGRAAVFSPIVNLCVPVIREKLWLGCATGTLDLKSIQEMLRPYLSDTIIRLTITDAQDRIIVSTDPKQAPMQPWNLKKTGVSEQVNATMFFWHPGDKNLPSMTRWKRSFYVQESLFRPDLPWKLIAEAAVGPLQSSLYISYVKNLSIIAVLTALALLLSQLFSQGLTRPLTELAEVTANLPEKLTDTQDTKWPVVFTQEIDLLINNFKSMTQTLRINFTKLKLQSDELSQVNRDLSLEIRERRSAEEALQESEIKLRTILENSVDAIGVSKEGIQTFMNPAYLSLFGYSNIDELINQPVLKLIAQSEHKRISERMRTHAKGDVPLSQYETRGLRKDGTEFDMDVHVSTYQIANESYSLVILRDITERKRAELELQEAEERFRSLSDATLEGIMIHDQGVILDVNRAFLRLFGYEQPEDLIGKNGPALLLTPESQARIRQRIQQGETATIEVVGVRKDGTTFDGETESRSVKYLGYDARIVSMHDVTERKQAAKEKAKLQNQLLQSQKIEAIGQLAGGVAHDFNNMLGVILGHTELAFDSVKQSDPLNTHLAEIRKAAQRSSELTSQLLAFARKQTMTPKVLDLNDTIDGMLKMLRRLIGEDIDLNWLPDSALWPVTADPSQIDQILANLCVNARDAIQGVGKITIETGNISFDEAYCADHAGYVPGDYVQLCVSDNGCGMEEEILDKLFEPFFTTKDVGKGTGLGLATVYGIVKQNSGYINVYSEPDQGTTFKIYLPRYGGQTEQQASTEIVQEPEMRGQETILLVEDEPSLLELNTLILESQGYRVLAAGGPGEALRLAEEHADKIHLLMTDVVMPEMNGRDLAKNLIALNSQLKCLFTSGYTANVIAHHGVLDEGVFFIQKPFSRKDLAAKVREVLDQK